MTANDGLVVHEYVQDADSFGWSVTALISVVVFPDDRRWGVLDALVGTGVGTVWIDAEGRARTECECVRDTWHLVVRERGHGPLGNGRSAIEDLVSRIFDHFLGGEPEDARFSRVAREMVSSGLWHSIPMRMDQTPVSGDTDGAKRTFLAVLAKRAADRTEEDWGAPE